MIKPTHLMGRLKHENIEHGKFTKRFLKGNPLNKLNEYFLQNAIGI